MKKQSNKSIPDLSRRIKDQGTKQLEKAFVSIVRVLQDNERRAIAERDLYKAAFQELRKLLLEAYEAYKLPGGRQDEKAREALKILGFTKDGKRQATYDKKALMYEYLALITGAPDVNDLTTWKTPPKPLDKKTATNLLKIKRKGSYESIYQHLNEYAIEQRRKHVDESNGWKHKKIMPTKIRKP